jgi:hypothetical protein
MLAAGILFAVAVGLLLGHTSAHLSIWHPSMFGLDPTNINSDNASQPLQDMTFRQWYIHNPYFHNKIYFSGAPLTEGWNVIGGGTGT